MDKVLSSLDFEAADLEGKVLEPYKETEEDLTGLYQEQDLSFALPPDLSEMEETLYQMMRASLAVFAYEMLRGPDEAPYNGRFLISDHHEEWSDHVRDHKRLCILAPRDHGKSFMLDFAYPIWMAWLNPGKAGFIFSATQSQASDILRKIREEIETNPKLEFLKPAKPKRWNDHEIQLANGHTIYARGFGTKVRGAHPVWIVCDDVLNDETAYSENVRKKQNNYFFSAVSNMLVPDGQLVVIGTPFHSSDLYAEIRERQAYFSVRYSAIKADGTPLWPERYTLPRLKWKRDKEVGPLLFAREFQCEPVSDDISLFPSYLFVGDVEAPNLKLGMSKKFWRSLGVDIYMGVDFAIAATTGSDYTVLWVMGVDQFGNRYIIDIFKAQGMPYRMQKSKIVEFGRRYAPELIFLEANQMQRIFGDELMQDTDLPIKQFHTTGLEKHSLERGLPSIRTLLEARKFRIPRGDERSVLMTNEWIAEMGGFIYDGKVQHVGKHDDMAMACWICDQAIRTGGKFSASWTGSDVFTKEELKAMMRGEFKPSVDGMIEEQVNGKTQAELDADEDKEDATRFGNNVKIIYGDENYNPDEDDEDDVDDVWTGEPLPGKKKVKAGKDWQPNESIPVPNGHGWF